MLKPHLNQTRAQRGSFSLAVPAAGAGNVKLELLLCGEAAGAAPNPGGTRA